jgi:hypothetical protein
MIKVGVRFTIVVNFCCFALFVNVL